MLARQKGGTIMTKIRYGFTVLAVCAGLLWAGIAGAQPVPPPNPGPSFPIPQGGLQNFAPVPQTGQMNCFAALSNAGHGKLDSRRRCVHERPVEWLLVVYFERQPRHQFSDPRVVRRYHQRRRERRL